MQTTVAHLQINVAQANLPFYRDLAEFLGLATIYGDDSMLGVGASNQSSLWFAAGAKDVRNDYDGPGMNPIAIGAEAQGDVDSAAEFLTGRGVALLFETPRHRPDFSHGENTYYQIMFESPDRILFEFVYTGPKAA